MMMIMMTLMLVDRWCRCHVTQVTTTRNIAGGWLVQWFCGGLGYQVRPLAARGATQKEEEEDDMIRR
jgi:hypothetical protein